MTFEEAKSCFKLLKKTFGIELKCRRVHSTHMEWIGFDELKNDTPPRWTTMVVYAAKQDDPYRPHLSSDKTAYEGLYSMSSDKMSTSRVFEISDISFEDGVIKLVKKLSGMTLYRNVFLSMEHFCDIPMFNSLGELTLKLILSGKTS